jgi:type II secretory pathway pseudopilin PulG
MTAAMTVRVLESMAGIAALLIVVAVVLQFWAESRSRRRRKRERRQAWLTRQAARDLYSR